MSMKTEYIVLNTEAPDEEVIRRAGRIIREGGLVAFPTETVYGLAADGRNAAAVRRRCVCSSSNSSRPAAPT